MGCADETLHSTAYPIMSGPIMNRLKSLFAAAMLSVSLAACAPAAEPPLAGAAIGGPFALKNQDGAVVRDTSFAGKYRIVYFGYTHCPDVCPLDMQNIAAGLRIAEKKYPGLADKVVPIFITIDPERDTPAVLKEFVTAFGDNIVGLTGTPQQIAEVAQEYAVWYQKQDTGTANYLMNHSRTTYLMGPDDKPIALIPADESADAVAETLEKWVQ